MKLVVLGMEDLDAQEATVCRVFRWVFMTPSNEIPLVFSTQTKPNQTKRYSIKAKTKAKATPPTHTPFPTNKNPKQQQRHRLRPPRAPHLPGHSPPAPHTGHSPRVALPRGALQGHPPAAPHLAVARAAAALAGQALGMYVRF